MQKLSSNTENSSSHSEQSLELDDTSSNTSDESSSNSSGKNLKFLKVTFSAVVKRELVMTFIWNGVPSDVQKTLGVAGLAKLASNLEIRPVRVYFDSVGLTATENRK